MNRERIFVLPLLINTVLLVLVVKLGRKKNLKTYRLEKNKYNSIHRQHDFREVNPMMCTNKLLALIREFSKVAGYHSYTKINYILYRAEHHLMHLFGTHVYLRNCLFNYFTHY